MNTRDARASAISIALPFRVFPGPDASIDVTDRQHVLVYRSIEAEQIELHVLPTIFVVLPRQLTFACTAHTRGFAATAQTRVFMVH